MIYGNVMIAELTTSQGSHGWFNSVKVDMRRFIESISTENTSADINSQEFFDILSRVYL